MSLLEDAIRSIQPQDQSWRHNARARLEQLTMPHWALGRLMDLAEDLAGMTRSLRPPVERKAIVVMAGDHGVVAEGVSKYPQVVTQQMVRNFANGGAGINALARQVGARVLVVDMGVTADLDELVSHGKIVSKRIAPGTQNIARGPAMSREQAIRSIEAGIEVVAEMQDSVDLLGTGDMGIGNTTPSSAIVAAITGCSAAEATGRGTGIGDEQLQHKISIVEQALRVNKLDGSDASDRSDLSDGLGVLAKLGGFEIGGIAGVILASASRRKPVLVDGFISTAGALIAKALAPACTDYMIAAHNSAEQGHRLALQHLGKRPLLDLEMRLGEGTGAALAMNLVEAAVRVLTDVKTFEEASVSKSVS